MMKISWIELKPLDIDSKLKVGLAGDCVVVLF